MSTNGKRSSGVRTLVNVIVAEVQEVSIGGALDTTGADTAVPLGEAFGVENRTLRYVAKLLVIVDLI
jgi:hypothetical protein